MTYALLVVEPLGQRNTRSDAEGREVYGRMQRFSEELKGRGLLTVSQSLKTGASDARVKVRGDSVIITDGPFAEVKEVMGGFFLLNCETREQATADRARMSSRAVGNHRSARVGPLLRVSTRFVYRSVGGSCSGPA